MIKEKIKIYDIENLPFATQITVLLQGGKAYRGVVFGKRIGFEDGSYVEMDDIKDKTIYLGWD